MSKLSTALLIGVTTVCFGGAALAQDGMAGFTKSAVAPAAPANQETGMRLNTGSDEFARFATDARPRSDGFALASGSAPDGAMNSGFPSGPTGTSSLAELPPALSAGGFSVGGGSTGPSGTPARPALAQQSAPVMLGLDTSNEGALSAGLSNNIRIGR
jgi:hypothetical protein